MNTLYYYKKGTTYVSIDENVKLGDQGKVMLTDSISKYTALGYVYSEKVIYLVHGYFEEPMVTYIRNLGGFCVEE